MPLVRFFRDLLKMLNALLHLLLILPFKRIFGQGGAQRLRDAYANNVDPETGRSPSGMTKKPDEVLPLAIPHHEPEIRELPGATDRLRYDRATNIIYAINKDNSKHE